jgi:hypothetical protein
LPRVSIMKRHSDGAKLLLGPSPFRSH